MRKQGRWIEVYGYCTPGGDPVWRCSECGKGIHVYGIEHGTYGADVSDGQWKACPNCGALMPDEFAEGTCPEPVEEEIIHCRECQFALKNKDAFWICGHPKNNAWDISEDHFCGYAKRGMGYDVTGSSQV